MKIAIFGGSFDPVHLGHIEIVKKALKNFDINKIIIMPNFLNPLKHSFSAPPTFRLKWLKKAFKNVVVNWLILAEDWKKMSKRLKNYPDPKYLLDKYWPDAFRLYVLSSPVVRAEPLRFSEKWVDQILKDVIIPLENVYKFLETYAKVDWFKHPGTQVWFLRHSLKEEVWRNSEEF